MPPYHVYVHHCPLNLLLKKQSVKLFCQLFQIRKLSEWKKGVLSISAGCSWPILANTGEVYGRLLQVRTYLLRSPFRLRTNSTRPSRTCVLFFFLRFLRKLSNHPWNVPCFSSSISLVNCVFPFKASARKNVSRKNMACLIFNKILWPYLS